MKEYAVETTATITTVQSNIENLRANHNNVTAKEWSWSDNKPILHHESFKLKHFKGMRKPVSMFHILLFFGCIVVVGCFVFARSFCAISFTSIVFLCLPPLSFFMQTWYSLRSTFFTCIVSEIYTEKDEMEWEGEGERKWQEYNIHTHLPTLTHTHTQNDTNGNTSKTTTTTIRCNARRWNGNICFLLMHGHTRSILIEKFFTKHFHLVRCWHMCRCSLKWKLH